MSTIQSNWASILHTTVGGWVRGGWKQTLTLLLQVSCLNFDFCFPFYLQKCRSLFIFNSWLKRLLFFPPSLSVGIGKTNKSSPFNISLWKKVGKLFLLLWKFGEKEVGREVEIYGDESKRRKGNFSGRSGLGCGITFPLLGWKVLTHADLLVLSLSLSQPISLVCI